MEEEIPSVRAFPRFEAWLGRDERFELVRFAILRLLGFVYSAAFVSLVWQVVPLVGERGILPANTHVAQLLAQTGGPLRAAAYEPSLFLWIEPTDAALLAVALVGLVLSVSVMLGVTNALVFAALWISYRSFVAVGQLWYGYGWELLLLETGFLAIFTSPLRSVHPFPRTRVPLGLVWLYRWLSFRIMLGAGLIKLRGDSCWRDLTCLDFHFETQPIPGPLSRVFHELPHWMHAGGVLFNHVAELILPFCLFLPRRARAWAGAGMIAFQLTLIASGNLSFLNWLTIVPLLASFDDRMLARIVPRRLRVLAERAEPPRARHVHLVAGVAALIALLSVSPVVNMVSRRQQMNAAFDSLMLVNSYGAFGSVGRERRELIIEGTRDADPGPLAKWQAYELPFKPGDPMRSLPLISPMQPRLDWQLWFAAMASAEDEPWLLHVVWQLLHADKGVRKLFAYDPFGNEPPRYIRIMRYRYRFAPLSSDAVWRRELEGYWLPPLPADDILRDAMHQLGYAE